MVYAGFRDTHRDMQDPPESARASPDPHDEELMEAKPDREEMEEAINKFLLHLEKKEKKGFKDLANILSQLPKPVATTHVGKSPRRGARPDQDEMEDAINQFLVQLEKQEKKGSRTWPACCLSCPSLLKGPLATSQWLTRSRPVFFQHWIKIRPICSLRTPYQQQGCFLMHPAISHSIGLPPTLRAPAVTVRAGRLA